MAFASACNFAKSNVYTLYTKDCGVNYRQIKAGDRIPNTSLACEAIVHIPASPMVGESTFPVEFSGNVRVDVSVDYEYIITDPEKFINSAKYLGRTNSSSDEVETNKFESAENSIIDKRIKETVTDDLLTVNLINFNSSSFEDVLLGKMNKLLNERGIEITFISLVPKPTEQIAQAIDVATAMQIYKQNGIADVGKDVIANKAGASRITVNVESPTKKD